MGCLQSKEVAEAPVSKEDQDIHDLEVLFFDCDDTLYQNNWATAERLKKSIERYTVEELGLGENEAFEMYLEHGTALRGLMKRNHLPEQKVEHFLQDVHNVSLEEIHPRPDLRELLLKLGHKRRWVFTASIKEHAQRCLDILGISDLFEGIVDCRSVGLKTKHDPMSFVVAMEMANITDATKCILFDDSVKNMRTAKSMGFKTCLVGLNERGTGEPIVCPEADYKIDDLMELPDVIPALFDAQKSRKFSMFPRKSMAKISDANELVPSTRTSFRKSKDSDYNPALEDIEDIDLEDNIEEEEEDDDVISELPSSRKRIIVVLGGPGSGKGTQCAKILDNFDGIEHLSAGDLLREEQRDISSEHGELIASCIASGKLVPSEITMRLIVKAMRNSSNDVFLVDGCPRDMDNYESFTSVIIDSGEAKLLGVLYYECEEEEMLKRILGRAEAAAAAGRELRSDDNVETAKKRFATFSDKTLPVIDLYAEMDMVYSIDASRSVDEVFEDTRSAVTVMVQSSESRDGSLSVTSRGSRKLSFKKRKNRKPSLLSLGA